LGDAYLLQDNAKRAREYYEESLALRREIVESPRSLELKPAERRDALCTALERVADGFLKVKQPGDAVRYAQQAIDSLNAIDAKELTPLTRLNAASARRTLGRARLAAGDLPGGRAEIDRAVAELRSLIKDDPGDLSIQRTLMIWLRDAGDQELQQVGDPKQAAVRYGAALKLQAALAATPTINFIAFERGISDLAYRSAVAELRAGNRAAADQRFRDCLNAREMAVRVRPGDRGLTVEVMLAQARCGLHDEAARLAAKVETEYAKVERPDRYYRSACWGYALCADAVGHNTQTPLPPDLDKLRGDYMNKAFAALEKAIAAGYHDIDEMQSDPDFDPLRSDPRFSALLQKMKK
jgi:hypothetical protein